MKTFRLALFFLVLGVMLVAPLSVSAAPPRPMPGEGDSAVPAATTATVSSLGLRLREGPSTSDAIIMVLAQGATVYPCAGAIYDDGMWWAYVYAYRDGVRNEGFCAAEYLSGYDGIPDGPTAPSAAIQYKVTAYYGLKLREGAGTSFDVVTIAPRGTILDSTTNTASADGYTWAEIIYSGQKLWAATTYLSQLP